MNIPGAAGGDRAAVGIGGREGAARLRQSRRPENRADEIPDSQLGPGEVQGQGGGVLRPPAGAAAARARFRPRRRHGLERTGRRPLVPRDHGAAAAISREDEALRGAERQRVGRRGTRRVWFLPSSQTWCLK